MNRYQIFKTLRHHRKLADRRALNYEQNRAAKYIVWFSMSFGFLYMLFLAVMLSLIANNSRGTTPLEFCFGLAPFLLLLDFASRFMAQQTPAQIVKPYYLLPLSRYDCIDTFVATSILTRYNFTWFVILVPFTLMSLVFSYGVWMSLAFLLVWWLLIAANSQWYLIVKTLTTDTLWWWLMPVGVYGTMALPILLKWGKLKGWENFFDLYATIGTLMERGNILIYIGVIALLVVLTLINRRLQYTHVRSELLRKETVKTHNVSQMKYLDKYGEIGMYAKMELRLLMRNKNPRKGLITAFFMVAVLCMIIVFTDIYDGNFYSSFWCIYGYLIFGGMTVMQVMSYEGNYIDCLLTHKENILMLLRTKYYIYSTLLLWPFLLMLPQVIAGKWSPLMLIAYGVFTAGFQYFTIFQLTIYNKQTMPLNTKFTGKAGINGNYIQMLVSFGVYLGPMLIISLLQLICSSTVSYIIMMLIGVVFIALHKVWLRNIYNRWMKRRYANMAALRASR